MRGPHASLQLSPALRVASEMEYREKRQGRSRVSLHAPYSKLSLLSFLRSHAPSGVSSLHCDEGKERALPLPWELAAAEGNVAVTLLKEVLVYVVVPERKSVTNPQVCCESIG